MLASNGAGVYDACPVFSSAVSGSGLYALNTFHTPSVASLKNPACVYVPVSLTLPAKPISTYCVGDPADSRSLR